jgi:hypothetical protein
MTTKHTQGPWLISEEQGDNYVISSASNELEICTVWEDPHKADARLIAAAPDLLEALCKLAELYDAMGAPRGPCRIIADAAIAKATEEQE